MIVQPSEVAQFLNEHHYLGEYRRGFAWRDEYGALVVAKPNARRLPQTWLELTRWCLVAGKNAGSAQWSAFVRVLRDEYPAVTTVVSYSDPSAGHDGALYRACNWLWAPTWHRLRPPPTGNGDWGTGGQGVKDRWVYVLREDPSRVATLSIKDDGLRRRFPWAEFVEPRWKRGHPTGGGGDFARARAEGVINVPKKGRLTPRRRGE